MLPNQKHLFQLPDDICYLNCAYMSPLLRSVEEAGIRGMLRKRNPAAIRPADFFAEEAGLRAQFAALVNGSEQQMAIIPSASYGLKSAVNNLPAGKGTHALVISDEFPSGYYSIRQWCRDHGKSLRVVAPPQGQAQRGRDWNRRILENINQDTAAVLLSSVHWTDGTLFDLQAIGERCREVDAFLIVDGTQSVGALPIDVKAFHIDALVCASYKWLLGPYSIGMAYFSEKFNRGIPLEDSWLNRANAADFARLTDYTDEYKPGAARYNVGQYSNFILLPMLGAALAQIAEWTAADIQQYCRALSDPLAAFLEERGFAVEEAAYRAGHIFGFGMTEGISAEKLVGQLQQKGVFVSRRGEMVRVSVHLYNGEEDVERLKEVL